MDKGKPSSSTIKRRDIVLIEDENRENRVFWKLGLVKKVIKGRGDVFIRGAELRLANCNRIQRPIQKLYPLEISSIESTDDTAPETTAKNSKVQLRER